MQRAVAEANDVPDVDAFFFYKFQDVITESDIIIFEKPPPQSIKPLVETKKVHQIS